MQREENIIWFNWNYRSSILCKILVLKKCEMISFIWDKVFKNGPSKICGRQPFKHLKGYGLLKQTLILQIFKRPPSTNFTWSILEYFVQTLSLQFFKRLSSTNFTWFILEYLDLFFSHTSLRN